MTLRTYLVVLGERWKLIALFVLAATAVAILVTVTATKEYEADVQVFAASAQNDPAAAYQGAAFGITQAATLAKTATSDAVVKGVLTDTKVPLSEDALRSKLSATATAGQSIIDLHVTDTDPNRAAELANSAAKYFINTVNSYYPEVNGVRSLTLHITRAASAPSSPVSPKPVLNIALGAILGLLVGIAVAVARDLFDNRIKNVEKLAKVAGKPAMGVIVEDPKANRHPIATRAGARNIRAENFRQLRANLQFANVDEHPRVIAITSSIPSEGKTMVALNLASTLAEAGFTVCLVDADLRRPTVAKLMGLPGAVGLTSVLIHQISLDEALQNAGSNLHVLSSGPTPPNPSEVLASSYVRDVIRSLLDRVDYVVLDTAPLLPVADGSEVAALADGALLVGRHKLTTEPQVKRAVEALRGVDAALLGVVFNRMPYKRSGEYGYAYYGTEQPQPIQALLGNVESNGRHGRRRTKPEVKAGVK